MPYKDKQKEAKSARERKKRYLARLHVEKYGPDAGDQRGKHTNKPRASRQHRWKPGGSVASNGYVKIRVGRSHPLADPNGYAYEHHVNWVSAGNPKPPKGHIIHHLNGDKTDNRIENLEMMSLAEHNQHHNAERGRCPTTGRMLPSKKTDCPQ